MKFQTALMTAFSMLVAAGCGAEAPVEELTPLMPADTAAVEQHASAGEGAFLFNTETFWGNNRTCATCHSGPHGTVNPQQVVARGYGDPLYRKMDSDNPASNDVTYNLLRRDATFNVTIDLPSNIRLANSSARKVTLRRGVPGTVDAPFFDTMLMFDGREASLQTQALGAIRGHAEGTKPVSQDELNSIAMYEKSLFSSAAMKAYADGVGPMPGLPPAFTASQQRGRAWFEPTALCGSCHNGPLLNRMTAGNPMGLPAGTQFGTALVSERNKLNNPMLEYIVRDPATGVEQRITTADPGLMLKTGRYADANLFKMLSLRNLRYTGPYFHDNSAKTIEDIMDQYRFLMVQLGIPHTDQDIADLTAYLYLL
jgi:cytochrome c peroxidase